MAEYSVAAGVGASVVQSFRSNIASTIALHRIGCPVSFSTAAAASRQDIFFSFGAFAGLGTIAPFFPFASAFCSLPILLNGTRFGAAVALSLPCSAGPRRRWALLI